MKAEERLDRRIRKTRAELKSGLVRLLRTKSAGKITVKDLVDEVGINRSTFYLHYTDIDDLLKKTEDDLLNDLARTVRAHPRSENAEGGSAVFFEDIFRMLADNREICAALIGRNGDLSFLRKIEEVITQNCMGFLSERFPGTDDDLSYFYSFALLGCLGMIRRWLSESEHRPPEHMARLASCLILNSMKAFGPDHK